MQRSVNDPPRLMPHFDLERFVRVQDRKVIGEKHGCFVRVEDLEVNDGEQETEYKRAIREIAFGEKHWKSDWVLFVFPRVSGLGKNINSIFYGIRTMEEAKAYLEHPILGPRLHKATEAVLESGENDLNKLFGGSDEASRFKSSMTLFSQVCLDTSDELFLRVILKFWLGERDEKTLKIMNSWGPLQHDNREHTGTSFNQ